MNNPDRARALLALADRVCAEEPTIGLAADLFNAGLPVECLTDLKAAAGAMPEGWRIDAIEQVGYGPRCEVRIVPPYAGAGAQAEAPDEPRARTGAALRAMAAEVGHE